MQQQSSEAEATSTSTKVSTAAIGGGGDIIEASLQYLSRPDATTANESNNNNDAVVVVPLYQASEAGNRSEAIHDGNYTSYKVSIANARGKEYFHLDKEGFLLMNHKSQVNNFYNDQEIKSIYEQEITELLTNVTGCKSVKIFDHTRRSSSADERQSLRCREPSSVVHNDYTEWSATKRLRDIILGGEEKDENNDILGQMKRRFAIVNVWRPINGKVECWPLCLCDSTTLDESKDIVSVKRISKDRIGEVQMAYYNSNHKWYYYPNMTSNEIILIKTYDSCIGFDDDDKIINRYTIHSAFPGYDNSDIINDDNNSDNEKKNDTTTVKTRKPRQSIETRAFCIY